ncbi:hypothetical protein J3F84DRAFT_18939 [Trichoderma pleuroticola]
MGSRTAMADGSAAASDAVPRAGCDGEATMGTMQRVSGRDTPKLDAMELEQEVPCRSRPTHGQGLLGPRHGSDVQNGVGGAKVSGRPRRLKTLVLVIVSPGKVGGDSSIAGDGDGGMGGEKKTDGCNIHQLQQGADGVPGRARVVAMLTRSSYLGKLMANAASSGLARPGLWCCEAVEAIDKKGPDVLWIWSKELITPPGSSLCM